MSRATTRGVQVSVRSKYHPEYSEPSAKQWFFSYTVDIANAGERPVQLKSRHWIITHASGREEEVRGEGVVGETPRLEPGEEFSYTSFCQLESDLGAMHGTYKVMTDDGEEFDVEIAPFTLADPDTLN